jgi:CheY-like chemotaxis protein
VSFKVPESIREARILIVDDNQTNLDILKGYLGHWGLACDTADCAAAALSLIHIAEETGAVYDLVISDMLMPEMDGIELGRQIKTNPELARTRLIMLTSQGIRKDMAEAQHLGFSAYLIKPVRYAQLFECIVDVLTNDGKENLISRKEPVSDQPSQSKTPQHNIRILVAEDNPTNQKLALHLLKRFGFTADTVGDGSQALEALSIKPYDLVLMDVQMPGMDGFETTRAIRNPCSTARNHAVPIIAMTAHAMKGDREKCLEAGMNDYIAKPIEPDILLQTIRRYLPHTAK